MTTRPAPRLYVLVAKRKPIAVILLRGPTKWYHVIRWDMVNDTFEHGAWFKGRIYEERCDISPDGELLLYFALQGSRWSTSYKGTWTAISRIPWLHALTLWPEGSTWSGGGYFTDDRSVTLEVNGLHTHPHHPAIGLKVAAAGSRRTTNFLNLVNDANWSGYDHNTQIIYTKDGKLFRQHVNGDTELADFNNLEPAPEDAPEWAKRPLPPLDTETLQHKRKIR